MVSLRERLNGFLHPKPTKTINEDALIVPIYKTTIGEFPQASFISAIEAYKTDPDVFNAVNFISNATLSDGFYITGNADYKNGKAIDLINDFNRNIRWGNRRSEKGLMRLYRIITKELLYGGNTFIEMLPDPNHLQLLNQIELSSIYKIFRSVTGDITKIQQRVGGVFNDLDPDNIIHIPWLQVDREPFGLGLIQPLISPRYDTRGRQIPAFYRIKASLEYDIWRMVHRKGVPRSIFQFENIGDEKLKEVQEELKDPDIDASFATPLKVDIKTEVAGPSQGISNLILFLDKRFQAGLQTPINNLLNSSGYTEASARVSEELGGLIVKDLQLYIGETTESELYDRILLQNGFDPNQAKIKLHWGKESSYEYTIEDILKVFDRKLISTKNAREMMRSMGLKLEDDSQFEEWLNQSKTATVATSQQIAVSPNQVNALPQSSGLISGNMQPNTQAKNQGMEPGQIGREDPSATSPPKGA